MSLTVASLGMHDRPELHAANDALWAAMAERLIAAGLHDAPLRLDRDRALERIWDDPALLFAQTCGFPLATRWRGRLRYISTPRYAVSGCEGSSYRSRLVVRHDEAADTLAGLRGRRAAINDRLSNSGMNMLRAAVAPLARGRPFFAAVIETGSHAESAALVATGGADVAAIDTVTFAHLQRHEPATARALRTLAWTPAAPGLPFVTSITTPRATVRLLRRTLDAVIADPGLAATRDALRLDGHETLRLSRYDGLVRMEARAARMGYPVLA